MSIKAMSLVWERYPRGGSEMLVALALADWCNDKGLSLHPSIRGIAEKARLSEVQARRIVRKMMDEGLLEVVGNEFGGAPGASRQYHFRIDRLPVEELQTGVARDTRTPLSGDTRTPVADDTRTALTGDTPTGVIHDSPTALASDRGVVDETALTGDRDGSHGRSRRLSPVIETALMGESRTTIEPSVNTRKPSIHNPAPKNEAPKNPKRSLPENFSISENVRDWAAQKGHRQLEAHFENFVGVARAKGYQYADWDAALMNAVRADWAKLGAAAEGLSDQWAGAL